MWGDLQFDELEAAIIQTPEMQRLRWIKQLGTAYVAYPGATHTRFEHSLGTCHIAGKVFDAARANSDVRLTKRDRALVRLVALLHDVAHIPFGHILEDELRLFGENTHDKAARVKLFLRPIAKDPTVQQLLRQRRRSRLDDQIAKILSSEPDELPKPYILEMVKNTVCADLLDYLARDYHYLGIRRVYDERIFHYFTVEMCDDGKPHFIVKLTEEGRHAEDSLTEMDNLLRIRYTLAERVWYHHAKLAADSMLDKALSDPDIVIKHRAVADRCGDEALLDHFERQRAEYPVAAELGELLKQRRLYKPAYVVAFGERGSRSAKWHKYMEPRGRRNAEDKIVEDAHAIAQSHGDAVRPEQVAIFCPEWEMNMKEALVLVHDEKRPVEPLMEHPISNAKDINQQHQRLWKFYVFCAEGVLSYVRQACEARFGNRP